MIKGIDVILYEKNLTGRDEFDHPIYEESAVTIGNVLVTPASSDAIATELNLTGKRIVYELCIPKGDAHKWEDSVVEFYGEKWHTLGYPQEWIESMVPLSWNKKVKVERYG